jgi:hypothetical protein
MKLLKLKNFWLLAFLLNIVVSPALGASSNCESDSETAFICGPQSPEDLLAIAGTPWIIATSMIDEGYISIVHGENYSSSIIFPSPNSEVKFEPANYSDCPGPPSSQFRPHGMSLQRVNGQEQTLYVVAHGERESVEVFSIDTSSTLPQLTWVGCVVAPAGVSLNSVTALPKGGFAVTNFNVAAGNLWEWQPESSWVEVPGSKMPGPNGLVLSPDGRWFYIGGWTNKEVVRLSRSQTPIVRESVAVGFHVDNVRWAPNGSLLAAGQAAESVADVGGCLRGGSCEGLSTRVARVSTDTLTAQQLLDYPSDDSLILGTVAIENGDELWVGAIAGGNKIGRFDL